MIKVIGVRFRTAGKVYFFDPLSFEIKRGDHVIVETARGIEYGTVVSGVHEVEDDKVIQPLKPVIRIATERDVEQEAANKEKEREAYKICLEKIRKHELEMKLIDAEYTFDNNKVLFYFTADGRIDFRELVKDLASVFKTRIELRQIGVRDETKIVGGIGICGRPLCCHSYLSDFIPVSIKMAKEQNLSLNITKISGVCGRLMCCLKNEEETYEELNRRLPGIGDFVTTDDGLKGEVKSVNVLRQIVKVVVDVNDEKEIRDYEVDRLRFKKKGNRKENLELSQEELRELERLEKEDDVEELDGVQERRQSRTENRFENRSDRRNDGGRERRQDRQARRNDNRTESRNENRNDNRNENRNDNRNESRPNCQPENNCHQEGWEYAQEEKVEQTQERQTERNEEGHDSKNESRQNGERRPDRRNEGWQERRHDRYDRRRDNRNVSKNNVRQDSNSEVKADNGQEGQQDAKTENGSENRRDPRFDRRPRRNRYGRNDGRNDRRNDVGNSVRNDGKNDGRKPENNDN